MFIRSVCRSPAKRMYTVKSAVNDMRSIGQKLHQQFDNYIKITNILSDIVSFVFVGFSCTPKQQSNGMAHIEKHDQQ